MRLNLRKIKGLIREAWDKGQKASLRGSGKSSCYSWSLRVAQDYFPDIDPMDAARIAKGQARLHWDANKREVVVAPLAANVHADTVDTIADENRVVIEASLAEPVGPTRADEDVRKARLGLERALSEHVILWKNWNTDDDARLDDHRRSLARIRVWAFDYGTAALLRTCSRLLDGGVLYHMLAPVVHDLMSVLVERPQSAP